MRALSIGCLPAGQFDYQEPHFGMILAASFVESRGRHPPPICGGRLRTRQRESRPSSSSRRRRGPRRFPSAGSRRHRRPSAVARRLGSQPPPRMRESRGTKANSSSQQALQQEVSPAAVSPWRPTHLPRAANIRPQPSRFNRRFGLGDQRCGLSSSTDSPFS